MIRKPQCWYKNLKPGDKVIVEYDKDYHQFGLAGWPVVGTIMGIGSPRLPDNPEALRISFEEAHLPSIYFNSSVYGTGWSGRILRKVK